MKVADTVQPVSESVRSAVSWTVTDDLPKVRGEIHFVATMGDEVIHEFRHENVVTLDSGLMFARLAYNSLFPDGEINRGINMFAIGTGATGSLLSPNAATRFQRKLNSQISRKAFTSVVFRDSNGLAVNYVTNVVDYTVTLGGSDAVGPLNEMCLLSAYSNNPANTNWIDNGPGTGTPTYDPTINVTTKDLMTNYHTFGVWTKPPGSVVVLTWRLTFG